MFRFLDAFTNAEEWDSHVPNDPHFASGYYRAFGGGALAVFEENNQKIVQPFRRQEKGWIGNAYNFGGPVGSYALANSYSNLFDEWKTRNKLSERCTLNPFMPMAVMGRNLTHRDVVIVDLTAIKLRATTRHMVEKAGKHKAATVVVGDSYNIQMFEDMYEASMSKKGAKLHWHYQPGTFGNVLNELGPKRSTLFITMLDGIAESGCLCIFDGKVCYYHWAATYGRRRDDGANHFQVWSVINWAKEQGFSYVHLGGGLSPDNPDDGLFKFKTGFSPITRKVFSFVTSPGD